MKKKPNRMKLPMNGKTLFVSLVSLCVVSAVVVGLLIAGSPEEERMRRADSQRLNDLQQITYAVDVYWNRERALPTSLNVLAQDRDVYLQGIADPRTSQPYEYRPSDAPGKTYELCATFETDSAKDPNRELSVAPANFWKHGIGQTCYTVEARDNRLPLPSVK